MDDKQRTHAMEAFKEAVGLARTQTAFAATVGLTQQTVSNRLRRNDLLPAHAVLAAERAYGISRHLLRPDIYPPVGTTGLSPSETVMEASRPSVAFNPSVKLKPAEVA